MGQFFDPDALLDGLGIYNLSGNIVDLGCGYGTFSIAVARRNKGMIYALQYPACRISIENINRGEKNPYHGWKSRHYPLELLPNNSQRPVVGYPAATRATGFELIKSYTNFLPFHYGLVGQKP
jgi:hypothetical protein